MMRITANPSNPHHGLVPEYPTPNCAVCGSDLGSHVVATGFDYEYQTCDNEWKVHQCVNCAHLQLHPRPADSALGTIYPANYYSYQMKKISPFALAVKARMDERKFKGIVGMHGRKPRSFLDVGCGDARYLKLMQRWGLPVQDVHGLEIDASVVAELRGHGLNVVCGRADTEAGLAHIADGSLDLITMFHVIEHLDDPGAVIKNLARKLAPGGLLVVETPNFDSLDARIFGDRYWGGYHFPRHWHIFRPQTLSKLGEDRGLQVRALRYQPGHAFWLFSLHHAIANCWGMPRLAKLVHPLKSLPALAVVVAFDLLRAKLGYKTSAMLMAMSKPSRS